MNYYIYTTVIPIYIRRFSFWLFCKLHLFTINCLYNFNEKLIINNYLGMKGGVLVKRWLVELFRDSSSVICDNR